MLSLYTMNSTILILDTRFGIEDDLAKRHPCTNGGNHTNMCTIFPRLVWETSELGEFLIEHHQKGILVITENLDIKRHIQRIFRDIPSTCGGVCVGDWVLYETPLTSIEEDETLWWVTPGKYPDPDEFLLNMNIQ